MIRPAQLPRKTRFRPQPLFAVCAQRHYLQSRTMNQLSETFLFIACNDETSAARDEVGKLHHLIGQEDGRSWKGAFYLQKMSPAEPTRTTNQKSSFRTQTTKIVAVTRTNVRSSVAPPSANPLVTNTNFQHPSPGPFPQYSNISAQLQEGHGLPII